MPNIRTYDADKLDFRPTEIGVDARAAAARRIGSNYDALAGAYRQVGSETESLGAFKGALQRQEASNIGSAVEVAGKQAEKWADHQQISAGAPAFAKLMQAKEQQWNDKVKNADPSDPTVGKKYLDESLEPDLQKFVQDGFYTEKARNWAEAQVNAFRQHMYNKTSADMSAAAGQAAVLHQHQTINSLSTTVRSDPSSLDFSLATLEHATDGAVASSPNMSAADAIKARGAILQKGKEEIIKSAAFGYIQKTGRVPDWASDPKYSTYINAAELKQFEQSAKYYQHLGEAEARSARAAREHEAKKDFEGQINRLEAATMPKNVGDDPQLPGDYWKRLGDLAEHPGAETGAIRAAVSRGEAITNRLNKPEPPTQVSRATYMELSKKIAGQDGPRLMDEGEIWKASDQLTVADLNRLRSEMAALKSPEGQSLQRDHSEFMHRFERVIDGGMSDKGGPSLLGTQRMYEFKMDARRQEDVLRKAGKDPHAVYDPRSPDYFGRPENIAKYHVSMQEALQYEKTFKAMDKANAAAPSKGGIGGEVTGVQVINQPAGAKTFVPPNDWQWSPSRQQYRDKNGALYDVSGNRVK